MKVLVADKLESEAIAQLREIPGVSVVVDAAISKDKLPTILNDVHVLVVRSKEVSREAILAGKKLSLIVRAGAGTNTIDVVTASEQGVYVANCPGKNAIAVAELTMGFICSIDRRLTDATASLRNNKWEKGEFSKADGLFGKRIGIAGLGSIGKEVLIRAKAFGLRPHAFSRSLTVHKAKELGVEIAPSLIELAKVSDIFTVHLPLNKETRGTINAAVIDALPARAIVVNTARGEVMDYAALRAAIASKGLRVGLDVFEREPEGSNSTFEDTLVQSISVSTPHIGASTQQAQLAIAAETVRIVKSFVETGEVPNCVNIAARSPVRCQLVIRHYDRVGVLANILAVIKQFGINVEEMTNSPFAGNHAACAKLRLAEMPSTECIEQIEKSTSDILHVEAIPV